MKKLVKYTVYFEYEDEYWDSRKGKREEDSMIYFIEEHNCHTNFLEYLIEKIQEQNDDICGAGMTEVIEEIQVPNDIEPYRVNDTVVLGVE